MFMFSVRVNLGLELGLQFAPNNRPAVFISHRLPLIIHVAITASGLIKNRICTKIWRFMSCQTSIRVIIHITEHNVSW